MYPVFRFVSFGEGEDEGVKVKVKQIELLNDEMNDHNYQYLKSIVVNILCIYSANLLICMFLIDIK